MRKILLSRGALLLATLATSQVIRAQQADDTNADTIVDPGSWSGMGCFHAPVKFGAAFSLSANAYGSDRGAHRRVVNKSCITEGQELSNGDTLSSHGDGADTVTSYSYAVEKGRMSLREEIQSYATREHSGDGFVHIALYWVDTFTVQSGTIRAKPLPTKAGESVDPKQVVTIVVELRTEATQCSGESSSFGLKSNVIMSGESYTKLALGGRISTGVREGCNLQQGGGTLQVLLGTPFRLTLFMDAQIFGHTGYGDDKAAKGDLIANLQGYGFCIYSIKGAASDITVASASGYDYACKKR